MKNLEVVTRSLGNSPQDQSVLIVADLTELASVITTFLSDGTLVTLGDGSQYRFNATATSGGIAPTTGLGRWWLLMSGNIEGVNVKSFGAVGDGVTDDLASLTAAAEFAESQGFGLFFPEATGYKITNTLTIAEGVSVSQRAPIIYVGNGNVAALVIGSAGNTNSRVVLQNLWVVRNTQSDWLNEAVIGIKLLNPSTLNVSIIEAQGFTIGVQIIADGSLTAHNVFNLGYIYNNKIGVDVTNNGGSANNENLFVKGQFTVDTGVGTNKDRVGVRITSVDGGYLTNNNNVFLQPSFELNQASSGTGEALPILIVHGTLNRFEDARFEGNSATYAARVQNASYGNLIVAGYSDAGLSLDNESSFGDNVFLQGAYRTAAEMSVPVASFNFVDLMTRPRATAGNTNLHVVGMSQIVNGDGLLYADTGRLRVTDGPILIVPNNVGIGIMMKTDAVKQFMVRRSCVLGNLAGRLVVRCYDENGTILTNSEVYAKAMSGNQLTYQASFGGTYSTSNDGNSPVVVEVRDEVKSVWVGVTGGTASAQLYGIHICGPNGTHNALSTYSGLAEGISDVRRSPVSPIAGPTETSSFGRGATVWSFSPSTGATPGWVCVNQVDTTIRVAAVAGTTIEVVSTTGILAGDIIGIRLDDSTTHWTTVASITDADTLELTVATPSDSGVGKGVYTNRWKAMANLA